MIDYCSSILGAEDKVVFERTVNGSGMTARDSAEAGALRYRTTTHRDFRQGSAHSASSEHCTSIDY